jgi:hypothetical protein
MCKKETATNTAFINQITSICSSRPALTDWISSILKIANEPLKSEKRSAD